MSIVIHSLFMDILLTCSAHLFVYFHLDPIFIYFLFSPALQPLFFSPSFSHPLHFQQQLPANRSTCILTVRCSFQLFFYSGQFEAAELFHIMITKPLRQQHDQTQLMLLQIAGDVNANPCPTTTHSCPVCTRIVTSYQCNRCSG